MAEKLPKAFVVSRGQTVSRTHNLEALLAEAVDAGGPLAVLEPDRRLLTPYAVMLRCPSAAGEPSEEEARQAFAAAEPVHERVRAALRSPSATTGDNCSE